MGPVGTSNGCSRKEPLLSEVSASGCSFLQIPIPFRPELYVARIWKAKQPKIMGHCNPKCLLLTVDTKYSQMIFRNRSNYTGQQLYTHGSFQKLGAPFWESLQKGPYYFGIYLGPPVFGRYGLGLLGTVHEGFLSAVAEEMPGHMDTAAATF